MKSQLDELAGSDPVISSRTGRILSKLWKIDGL